jgi:phage gp36-like protein
MLLLLIKVYGIFLHAEIIRIITDVDAEIDAALYRRYTTPFADRSQLILNLAQFREYVVCIVP